MTTYYGELAPLGSGKTTAAIEFAGYAAQAGQKIAIAQPSIKLIDQSVHQFRNRWPDVAVRAIHSDISPNVAHELTKHTRASSGGEVLFLTHATLMQTPYWDRRKDWRLIIDEAPQVFYHTEFTLPINHHILLPALETVPHNIRYSHLLPGDVSRLEAIAENRGEDQVDALFQEFARMLTSNKWDMFVLTEQWERFQTGQITDGKLLVFGLVDPAIFDGFDSVTMMSANLDRTIAYQHLVQHGRIFGQHKAISSRLRFQRHDNGHLLTIHYAVEDGNWSKHRRDKVVSLGDETYTVNDLIVAGTLDLFGDQEFVWLANKDIEDEALFSGRGVRLPHSPHGLNSFQHIHNAAVLPALNPSPALYSFLDEVAHLNSEEVRRAVYHEAAYQAAGRISLRNPEDIMPKRLVVADRGAAQAIADLFPGAQIARLPCSELIPQGGLPGRHRTHATDAARKKDYRDRHTAELLNQLAQVNGYSSETKIPYSYKVNSSLTKSTFGGSLFAEIWHKHPADHLGGLAAADFIGFLRDLHNRTVAKEDAWLWSPSEFEAKAGVETGRGLDNITAIHGVFLDNDGGDLSPEEFAAMFPHLIMVIHNSSSSTPDHLKWRVIIPTTCAMTIDVHREIMLQIRQALNRRCYYDKKQLARRADKGLAGRNHGFDPSKYNAASMFYLPAQAAAGPEASFFLVFDGGKREAINPFEWIDKSIINHRPEPEPEPVAAVSSPETRAKKDPKLARMVEAIEAHHQVNYQERVDAAIQRWRQHPKGSGNEEFFRLAASLNRAGLPQNEVRRTLYDEAAFAHGTKSQRDRRAAIPNLLRRLRFAA